MIKEQRGLAQPYIPPLRFHWLTPAYDALVRWTCSERDFRDAVLATLGERRLPRIVDLGCGTGSFLSCLHQLFPMSEIIGVDADEAALHLAARKTEGTSVSLWRADARQLPFEAGSVAAFTSSLFFHHLRDGAKLQVLHEVRRCLAPGGVFVIADWDRADSAVKRAVFNAVRALDGFGVTGPHAHGRFAEMIVNAGFAPRVVASIDPPLGRITVWRCEAPAP